MSSTESTHHGGSRFGRLSANMFFIRNTAKPKRVRHIEGLNGALICNVNDDAAAARSAMSSSLSFSHNSLAPYVTPRRVERLVPPMGFWNTYGVIHDTEHWKQELASLATASGLGIEKDDPKPAGMLNSTTDQQLASRSGAHYSTRTGRFNETAGRSRGRTNSKHNTGHPETIYRVAETEREMWMLQVLCQLLGTSSLEEVQSWLVSASPAEKDQARVMISSALRGLKESERAPQQVQQSVDLNSLSDFVERKKHEEKYASQKFVSDTLSRSAQMLPSINEEIPYDMNSTANESMDRGDDASSMNVSLQSITTYKNAFPNYQEKPFRLIGRNSGEKRNDTSRERPQPQEPIEEQIDTIQLSDDRQRPKISSEIKIKRTPQRSESAMVERSSSNQQSRGPFESIQFNDNGEIQKQVDTNNEHGTKAVTAQRQDEQNKSRRIRELQQKLTRQEEESKRLFDELQSKQSRLENAIKLLMKNTGSSGKQRPIVTETRENEKDDSNAPVINLIIQSPRDSNNVGKMNKTGTAHTRSIKILNDSRGSKPADYPAQDVKVQISLSRLDDRTPKVFTGVWKPDASTFQRLQGN